MIFWRLITLGIFALFPMVSSAQTLDEVRITKAYEKVTLANVLKEWRKEYKLKIAYDNDLIKGVIINQSFDNEPLQQALEKLLSDTPLNHLNVNNKIIIVP